MYELTAIMRQKDDKVYAELLSRLREGIHSQDAIEKLKSRIIDESYPHYPFDAVLMFATNAEVDTFNETAYDRTSTEKIVVKEKSAVIGDVTPIIRQKTIRKINPYQLSYGFSLLIHLSDRIADKNINIFTTNLFRRAGHQYLP